MAINLSQSFHRTSAMPIDETMALTKAQMLTVNDNLMPDKYLTVCQDDGEIYLYDKSSTASQTTGKFKKFEGGGSGGVTDFDELTNRPKNVDTFSDVLEPPSSMSVTGATYFGKADMYTTDEKIVGSWMGKPLYQKTYQQTITQAGTDTVIGTITGAENVTKVGGFIKQSGSGSYVDVPYYTSSTDMCIVWVYDGTLHGITTYPGVVYVTLQYTKTTDAANSFHFATQNDYSEAETVVGAWIDGSPIYQKTFTTTIPNASSNGSYAYKTVSLVDLNYDKVVSVETMIQNSSMKGSLPLFTDGGYKTKYNINNDGISIANDNTYANGADAYFTIRYTKVSA